MQSIGLRITGIERSKDQDAMFEKSVIVIYSYSCSTHQSVAINSSIRLPE